MYATYIQTTHLILRLHLPQTTSSISLNKTTMLSAIKLQQLNKFQVVWKWRKKPNFSCQPPQGNMKYYKQGNSPNHPVNRSTNKSHRMDWNRSQSQNLARKNMAQLNFKYSTVEACIYRVPVSEYGVKYWSVIDIIVISNPHFEY